MSWLGKVVGGAFGFVMGGPLGAALGVALGDHFDRGGSEIRFESLGASPEETEVLRQAFFIGVFQVMGHVAKADGRVSEAELHATRQIMDRMMLGDDLRILAMRLFNEGKADRLASLSALDTFRAKCDGYAHLTRLFMAIQLEVALADGSINSQEERALLQICDQLGFSRYEFFGIKTRLEAEQRFGGLAGHAKTRKHSGRYRQENSSQHGASGDTLGLRSDVEQAYAVLQLQSTASASEIKKAYRRLISRHHPDKLVGKGHGSESLQMATETTQKIQRAYDLICKVREL